MPRKENGRHRTKGFDYYSVVSMYEFNNNKDKIISTVEQTNTFNLYNHPSPNESS